MSDPIEIFRLTALRGWRGRLHELDPIFFEASYTKAFASDAVRAAFHKRWLGRYLDRWPSLAHVALGEDCRILGYIVGAHQDPAADPLFADIGYWPHIAHLTARFPAHLHINLAADVRGRGTGSRLIEAFCDDARVAGAPGVHLVTGRDSRNRSFYARNGFAEVAALVWGGTPIVMLARQL
ncbi:MAG: GNAT family N-acetyltransferase [Hyphomicrobiaceae bacterium]|nr:GNAT family N-acetyltransferase [Hyphomicrobiaceae bacterium]